MNAKRLFYALMLSILLLSACAPAATQAPIAIQPKATSGNQYSQQTYPAATAEPRWVISTQQVMSTRVVAAPPLPRPEATMAPAQLDPGTPYYGSQNFAPYYPAPAPQDNTFQDYGVNPFIDSRRDHLSTFAVDVDIASYTVARRYVMDGSLPPAEAVRVEEFVNYFNPGYNPPENSAFAIYADGAPSPFQADGTQIVRIGIQGYRVPSSQRKPVSLTFVIDISGSMDKENRLELVKRSLDTLVSRLQQDDSVGIVVFGTEARVLIDPTPVAYKNQIVAAINSLYTEGSTNAEAGIRLGFELARQGYRSNATNRVILCSDGVANVGNVSADSILEFVQGSISEGISLSTYGFGMGNFNDALLEQLADKGNGMYAYIDDDDEARRLFIEELTSTLQTIAMDAKVQVDFNADVVARYRLMGYENRAVTDQNFRNDSVDAGEIGAGHHVVAMYALQFKPGAAGRIATVQLRWQDPQTRQVTEINGNLNTWDLAPDFNQAGPYFQLAATVAQYAEMLRGSPWARTSMSLLSKYASWLSQKLPEDTDVSEFATLVQRVSLMWHPDQWQ